MEGIGLEGEKKIKEKKAGRGKIHSKVGTQWSRQKILVNNYQVLDARMMTVISSKAAKWSCAYLQNIICKANLRIPRGYIPVSHASASQKENI